MTPSHPVRREALHMDVALIAFDGVDTAAEAYADARDRSGRTRHWQDQGELVEHHEDGLLVLHGTFAGHYVDVDEAAHTSEEGAAKGWRKGALAGFLLTPAGFAVGSVLGAVIGSQEGEPSERDREPTLLADKLWSAVPLSGSGVVLAAEARVDDEMLSAFELDDAQVTRRTLSEDELAVIEVALSDEPVAATSSEPSARASQGAI
jgi:uncharacterized membrane protein